MKKILLASLCCMPFFAVLACAMPGMTQAAEADCAPTMESMEVKVSSSYSKMDTNNDGAVSREDFCRVYPSMTDAAFGKIDANSDGNLSKEEWAQFLAGHGAGGMSMPGKGQTPPSTDAQAAPHSAGAKPLITPPVE